MILTMITETSSMFADFIADLSMKNGLHWLMIKFTYRVKLTDRIALFVRWLWRAFRRFEFPLSSLSVPLEKWKVLLKYKRSSKLSKARTQMWYDVLMYSTEQSTPSLANRVLQSLKDIIWAKTDLLHSFSRSIQSRKFWLLRYYNSVAR